MDEDKESIINNYNNLKESQKLMKYLNDNCDFDLMSYVFDRYYYECLDFYVNLVNEGLKYNNAVAHHKKAIYLMFNKNKQDSFEKNMHTNFVEAKSHLEESINQNYTKSYFSLARLLHEFFHEDSHAFIIAKKGSEKGDKYSKCLLGYFISKGIMLESNASDYYERFSNDIGLYYINLIKKSEHQDTINECKAKAFEYFEKAFKMNQTKATINNYGICFMLGIGVSKNIEKAKEIFQIGISKGDINSKYHYAFILENENSEK